MTRFADIIIKWLSTEATQEEIDLIMLEVTRNSILKNEEKMKALINETAFIAKNQSKLKALQHLKYMTGWGLKESKRFMDENILPPNEMI